MGLVWGTPIKEVRPLPASSEPAPGRGCGRVLSAQTLLSRQAAIIMGFPHSLFLTYFSWMLVKAMILFLLVRNMKVANDFSSPNLKMLCLPLRLWLWAPGAGGGLRQCAAQG